MAFKLSGEIFNKRLIKLKFKGDWRWIYEKNLIECLAIIRIYIFIWYLKIRVLREIILLVSKYTYLRIRKITYTFDFK